MANLGGRFDPAAVPENERNFEPMPNGMYQLQIVDSEIVDIARGQMLKVTFEVAAGQFQNRKVWGQYCIRHDSEQAQAIAQRALADMFIATGTPPSEDSDDLHFKPFMGRLRIEQDEKKEFPPKNVVKEFKAMGGAAASPPAQKVVAFNKPVAAAARSATTRPAAGGKSTPWGKPAAQVAAKVDDDIPY